MDLGGRSICIRGRKLVSGNNYWRRVNHVDQTTVTCDSFMLNEKGTIVQLTRNFSERLNTILDLVYLGHLQIE